MATIRKKMEFYNYMKKEEKVEEKRDKTNKKLAFLKQLEKQKQELNEKSRSLIQFIQVISKSMVVRLHTDQLPSHVQQSHLQARFAHWRIQGTAQRFLHAA